MAEPSNELPDVALDMLIARERAHAGTPLTEWHTLSARLRDEGLIRPVSEFGQSVGGRPSERSAGGASRPIRGLRVWQWSGRIVAGAALLGIGMIVGAGRQVYGHGAPANTVASTGPGGGDSFTAPVRSVANEGEPFASSEAAKQALLKAQSDYQRAAAYLTANDTSAQIVGTGTQQQGLKAYQVRLAALDTVMSATRRALKDAPHDPVLHQYYQLTVGAREATVQQLTQVVPVGMQVSRF